MPHPKSVIAHVHNKLLPRCVRTKGKDWKAGDFLRVGTVSASPEVAIALYRRLILNDKVAGGRHVSLLQAWTLNAAVVELRCTSVPFGAVPIKAMLPS